jgi:hypothetical protein
MRRTTSATCALLIAIILTIASTDVVRKVSAINYEKGWSFVTSSYSTDGIKGPVVYESSPTPDPYKFGLNFIFYLLISFSVVGFISKTMKHKTPKSK